MGLKTSKHHPFVTPAVFESTPRATNEASIAERHAAERPPAAAGGATAAGRARGVRRETRHPFWNGEMMKAENPRSRPPIPDLQPTPNSDPPIYYLSAIGVFKSFRGPCHLGTSLVPSYHSDAMDLQRWFEPWVTFLPGPGGPFARV